MTSKRRENINLVSFICLSFLVINDNETKLSTQISLHVLNYLREN